MSRFVEPSRSRAVSRLALLAVISAGMAGCSSDRFMESPQASRQQASPEVTGSVQPAPTNRVESSSLPPPSYGGGAGIASHQQPPARQDVTGSVSSTHPKQPPQNWSWDGGTAIVVAQGETIDTISRRHGVPPHAIMQANNMTHAAQLQPGQRLVIPRVQQPIAAAPQIAPPTTRVAGPIPAPSGNGGHIVKPGETIYSLARQYRLTPMAIAKANNVGLDHRVKVGDRIVIPGSTAAAPRLAAVAPAPAAQPKQAQPAPQQVAAAKPAPQVAAKPETAPGTKPQSAPKVAKVEAQPTANIVAPAADPLPESTPTGTTGNSSVSLRWPVRGKVIQGFGPKSTGGQNDGINVAVPEGTPIKAAEDGVVAYAGSELKGYGNLVLVRHSNGFVTAYAHASELSVKKGETIKRGQVIGKAGSTGNVTSPQLHFEVRKGATPVDPTQYLTGG